VICGLQADTGGSRGPVGTIEYWRMELFTSGEVDVVEIPMVKGNMVWGQCRYGIRRYGLRRR
jgi:hypothetical protein